MEKNKYIFFEMNRCARLIKRHIDNDPQTACKNVERLTGAHGWMIGFLYLTAAGIFFSATLKRNVTSAAPAQPRCFSGWKRTA